MRSTSKVAAGIATAFLLSVSGGQAWADAPAERTVPMQEQDDSAERESGNDDANEDQYDSGEYRGDDDSTSNRDENLADVDLLNTSPDENNGDEDK